MTDALLVLGALLGLILVFRKIGLWKWVWLSIALIVGGWELIAVGTTGQTLSQQFWTYSLEHPTMGWVAASLVAIGGIGLTTHLMWKVIKRGKNGGSP